jgi:flagellar hook-associated protein 3 FlgL
MIGGNRTAAAGNRVTTSMANRRFVNRLQINQTRKNESTERIITQRRFTRASQNPLDAARALRGRRTMSEVETYKRNLDTAAGIYDVAESNVRQISSILQTLHEKLIQAANDTYSQSDKDTIALNIETLAEQMVSLMNVTVAGRQIFSGVNNGNQASPHHNGQAFQIDINTRTVLYNGVPVNTHSDPRNFPDSRTSFLDVGLGMRWLDEHTIDPQTAIPVTFNGAQILGSGTSVSTRRTVLGDSAPNYFPDFVHSNNLIQLALDAAGAIRAGQGPLTAVYADLVFESQSFLSLSIARIGSDQSFIEFNQDRLLNLDYSLREQQNDLEFVDLAEETTRWKMLEMIYNATLQMSASTVPMSIFSFIR